MEQQHYYCKNWRQNAMTDNDTNAAIAQWMGEKPQIIYVAREHPDSCAFDSESMQEVVDWCNKMNDFGRSYKCYEFPIFPDYLRDPAAALRVLAKMNRDLVGETYELLPIEGECDVIHYKGAYGRYTAEQFFTDDTPAAAICAAWVAEFGEQPRDGGKE
jgi:hypothetical protein